MSLSNLTYATARHRIDPVLGEVLLARYRPSHRCRSCRNTLTAHAFAPSRIPKRDYECRRCNALRCARERLQGRRRRRKESPE